MSIFRKAPTAAEVHAVESQLLARREAREKAEEAKAAAKAEEKQNRPPPDPLMPKVTFGRSFRRFSDAEVEAIAENWRAKYERFDDDEIKRLAEEKPEAALKADGYAIPKRTEPDRLKKLLLRRQTAKGNN